MGSILQKSYIYPYVFSSFTWIHVLVYPIGIEVITFMGIAGTDYSELCRRNYSAYSTYALRSIWV